MNEWLKQIKLIWSELGINQKISLGIATIVILSIMAALVVWSAQPNMQLLYGKLPATEMAEVVAHLDEQNIPYKMASGGSSIYVPSEHVYTARMKLATKGVPSGGGVGYEIFDKSNFGISEFIQRTNYNRAIQGELARTVAQLNGVRSARVMVVVPENRLLAEANQTRPTASVFVETGGLRLRAESVDSIRFLVANSVEGLSVNDVAVIDNNGNVLSEELKDEGTLKHASSQIRYRKSVEDYFSKKVETLLSKMVGAGNVVAKVSVEIDSEGATIVNETFDPESQVVRSQTVTENTATNKETESGLVVGAKGVDGIRQDTGPLTSNEEMRKNKTVNYEINKSTVQVVRNAGGIKKISASVLIAKKLVDENGKQVAQSRSSEELKDLQEMVANALGIDFRLSGEDTVTIQEVEFAGSIPAMDESLLSPDGPILGWVDIARNFVAVGVAFIMFVVFLRVLKKHRPSSYNLQVIQGNEGRVNHSRNVTPRPTPDLLNELIKQKPENVSTALKNWMNNNESDN